MAHNGLQQRAEALNTPVEQSTGEIQIPPAAVAAGGTNNLGFQGQPVGVQIGMASNQNPQMQSVLVDGRNADQSGDSQGGVNVSSSNQGPQTQSAPVEGRNASQNLGTAGPQTQSASDTKFDRMLETMNNMATAMASQAQGLAASTPRQVFRLFGQ